MVQGGFSIAGLGEKDRIWFKEGLVLQGWERNNTNRAKQNLNLVDHYLFIIPHY